MARFGRMGGGLLAFGWMVLAVAMLAPAATAQERPKIELVPRIGHTSEIIAAAFSPDGTLVGCGDGAPHPVVQDGHA